LMGPFVVEAVHEGVQAHLLLEHVVGRGPRASVLSVRCIRSCRPFCSGWLGADALQADAESQPPLPLPSTAR
jgi:hypothetical protein